MRNGQVKTHCKHGHPLKGDNVYVGPSANIRECVTCRKANERKRVKGPDPRADEIRFFGYVTRDEGGCWIFELLSRDGYGRFWFKGKQMRAHRWAFEFLVGPIPDGFVLDHLCRNRACVNPDHLEPVTQRINTLRGETLPAQNILKLLCVRGHRLDGDNLRRDAKGRRRCRECHRINAAASRARRSA